MSSVFGPIVTGSDVEDAVVETLKLWLPTYLAEMERLSGRAAGVLPDMRSWSSANRFGRRPQDQLPAGIVVSPGLADRPFRRGDGTIGAWWRISLAVIASGNTQETTNELAKLYGAAIRTLFVQRASLGGFAGGLELVNERYDDVPADYLEVGAVVVIEIDVQVDAISDASAGPAEPDLAPGAWPTVTDADIAIELRSLT